MFPQTFILPKPVDMFLKGIERQNYNLPKGEGSRSPETPRGKEEAIVEAFKHFQMI